MTWPRWLRFATDRSQLIIITGVLVMVVALFGFAELAVEKSAALVANERAQNELARLEAQNRLLLVSLEQARLGQHVAPKAYQYFGLTPEDVTLIVPQVAPESEAASAQRWESVDPWAEIAEWLDQTLTNLLDRVQ